ncbi:fimbrial protein [Citrobacter amalonaticus]|uniref:fimbrial protein n=1 Tax=Citrobacter farmeri TaxID=67824 RepID=UPI00050F4A41|nr:fimbrial protein [Citrobacter farmeri]MDB2166944.1 fimbrial protein [Citrobacter farmeri]QXA99848.1 type 1 fimbrial protein [Citrobacter farmeri]GAL51795.1 putative fimbrial protein [Citrobacter farmeri GTC 1319]
MKMNRLLVSVLMSSTILSTGALASNGTINFTGTVVASACDTDVTVSYTGGSYTSTAGVVTAQIDLPDTTPASLSTVGSYAGHTPFSIKLTNCLAGTTSPNNVYTRFVSGQTAPGDSNVLANTASSGAATNVGIAILRPDNQTQININADRLSSPGAVDAGAALPVSTGSADSVTLNYVAAYKALGASVGTGDVAARTQFEIVYY